MSSCKREDIVSDTVVDSTESTSLCETESATENVDERIILENEKMVQKGYTLVTTTFQEPSKILMIYKSE